MSATASSGRLSNRSHSRTMVRRHVRSGPLKAMKIATLAHAARTTPSVGSGSIVEIPSEQVLSADSVRPSGFEPETCGLRVRCSAVELEARPRV